MRPIALPDLSSCLEPLPLPQGRGQNQQAMHTLNRRTTKCLLANLAQPWPFLLPSTWLSASADPQCDLAVSAILAAVLLGELSNAKES